MTTELPEYYFRIKENGAFVFKVDTDNRHRRIEMDQIAVLNTRNGDIKPQGNASLTDADMAAINSWLSARMDLVATRDFDEILRTTERLNLTTHWANSRATDAQLETMTDDLLLAMHDLRSVLVKKKSGRISRG
ncbi:MAG: hypothetical protein V3U96_05055 [Paracoccaceae bacterium]